MDITGRAAVGAVLEKEGVTTGVVSSSNIPIEGSAEVVRALAVEEIASYVSLYAKAAKAFVEECGGDGVVSILFEFPRRVRSKHLMSVCMGIGTSRCEWLLD